LAILNEARAGTVLALSEYLCAADILFSFSLSASLLDPCGLKQLLKAPSNCQNRLSIAACQGITDYRRQRRQGRCSEKFQEKCKLPFSLVADSEGLVAKAFGVPTLAGFARRQSFLIKDGKIAWRDLNASTKNQAADVRQAMASLDAK